ncbi:hypothetical protein KKA53_05315 [Candidatus Dependentiae bacterium]|nr:hypothetical protein [Candidatus Dependentiae bacterium]
MTIKIGKLFVIEGLDGTGKAIQAKMLFERINADYGVKSEVLIYPNNNSPYGKFLASFDNSQDGLSSHEQLLLYIGELISQQKIIREKLKNGINVILVRYYFSVIAHHFASIANDNSSFSFENGIMIVNSFDLIKPDMIFFIRISAQESIVRTGKALNGNNEEFFALVSDYYNLLFAEDLNSKYRYIDGMQSNDEIHNDIVKELKIILDEG